MTQSDDGGADHITLSELRSKCWIWGAATQLQQYNQFDGHQSLLTGFHYNFLSSPHFWHLLLNSDIWPNPSKMANFDNQKSKFKAQKKVFFWNHIDMCFLQKTGFKLVKFGQSGSIYTVPNRVPFRGPRSPRGPFCGFGSPLGLLFCLKVPFFLHFRLKNA